jgi:hypothetical protein
VEPDRGTAERQKRQVERKEPGHDPKALNQHRGDGGSGCAREVTAGERRVVRVDSVTQERQRKKRSSKEQQQGRGLQQSAVGMRWALEASRPTMTTGGSLRGHSWL